MLKPQSISKVCFVPSCFNTSSNQPGKKFITVPKVNPVRRNWFSVVGHANPQTFKTYYCCEDHFDMSEDVESTMLKEGVLPHLKLPEKKPNKPKMKRKAAPKKKASKKTTSNKFSWLLKAADVLSSNDGAEYYRDGIQLDENVNELENKKSISGDDFYATEEDIYIGGEVTLPWEEYSEVNESKNNYEDQRSSLEECGTERRCAEHDLGLRLCINNVTYTIQEGEGSNILSIQENNYTFQDHENSKSLLEDSRVFGNEGASVCHNIYTVQEEDISLLPVEDNSNTVQEEVIACDVLSLQENSCTFQEVEVMDSSPIHQISYRVPEVGDTSPLSLEDNSYVVQEEIIENVLSISENSCTIQEEVEITTVPEQVISNAAQEIEVRDSSPIHQNNRKGEEEEDISLLSLESNSCVVQEELIENILSISEKSCTIQEEVEISSASVQVIRNAVQEIEVRNSSPIHQNKVLEEEDISPLSLESHSCVVQEEVIESVSSLQDNSYTIQKEDYMSPVSVQDISNSVQNRGINSFSLEDNTYTIQEEVDISPVFLEDNGFTVEEIEVRDSSPIHQNCCKGQEEDDFSPVSLESNSYVVQEEVIDNVSSLQDNNYTIQKEDNMSPVSVQAMSYAVQDDSINSFSLEDNNYIVQEEVDIGPVSLEDNSFMAQEIEVRDSSPNHQSTCKGQEEEDSSPVSVHNISNQAISNAVQDEGVNSFSLEDNNYIIQEEVDISPVSLEDNGFTAQEIEVRDSSPNHQSSCKGQEEEDFSPLSVQNISNTAQEEVIEDVLSPHKNSHTIQEDQEIIPVSLQDINNSVHVLEVADLSTQQHSCTVGTLERVHGLPLQENCSSLPKEKITNPLLGNQQTNTVQEEVDRAQLKIYEKRVPKVNGNLPSCLIENKPLEEKPKKGNDVSKDTEEQSKLREQLPIERTKNSCPDESQEYVNSCCIHINRSQRKRKGDNGQSCTYNGSPPQKKQVDSDLIHICVKSCTENAQDHREQQVHIYVNPSPGNTIESKEQIHITENIVSNKKQESGLQLHIHVNSCHEKEEENRVKFSTGKSLKNVETNSSWDNLVEDYSYLEEVEETSCGKMEKSKSFKGGQQRMNTLGFGGIKEPFYEPQIYSCQKCDFTSRYSSALKVHISEVHKRYYCIYNNCSFSVSRGSNLKEPISEAHWRKKVHRSSIFRPKSPDVKEIETIDLT